jgi:hypothetical protein
MKKLNPIPTGLNPGKIFPNSMSNYTVIILFSAATQRPNISQENIYSDSPIQCVNEKKSKFYLR